MESNLLFEKNNNNDIFYNEEILLNSKSNNQKRKKNLPKINLSYSNLEDVSKKQNILKKNKSKKLKVNLKSLKSEENLDFAKEIKQAKEFEDLEKIYEKWLNHGKDNDNNKINLLFTEGNVNKKKNKIVKNNLFLKGKKNNNNIYLKYKNNLWNNQEENILLFDESFDENLKKNKDKNLNFNKNKNKLKLKAKKPKEEEEKIRKEMEENLKKELEEKIKKEMEEKIKKEMEQKIKKEMELKMKKELQLKQKELDLKQKEIEEMKKKELDEKKKMELELKKAMIIKKNEQNKDENINIVKYNNIKPNTNEIKNYEKKETNNELNNNKIILNEDKRHKYIKEEISETNDESVSDKFKNMYKNEIAKKILDINEKSKDKNNNNLNEEENYNKKILRNTKKKNRVTKSIELNDIIKNANIFSNKMNLNLNLEKKFEYATALDKYIQNEIKTEKNNLITPNEAMYYIENNIIRFFGYFGSETSYRNINTFIEKTSTNNVLREISFKILASGLATQKVYKLIIQDEDLKIKLDEEDGAWENYIQDLKTKISNGFNILEDDIYFFCPKYDKYEISLIIYNKTIKDFEDFLRNKNLKFFTSLLLNNIILSPCIFDENYCKLDNNWTKRNSIRGGKVYHPPYGWYGISLKVLNKYNRKNSIWLGKQNLNGEWPIAYHAIGNGNVFDKILDILNGDLKNEETKLYKNYKNKENNKDKYPNCGEGIYCCPDINDVEKLADKTSFGFYNTKFQFVLMVRVNPNKIRSPGGEPICWILNGTEEEIRPYRLLFKICTN